MPNLLSVAILILTAQFVHAVDSVEEDVCIWVQRVYGLVCVLIIVSAQTPNTLQLFHGVDGGPMFPRGSIEYNPSSTKHSTNRVVDATPYPLNDGPISATSIYHMSALGR